MIMFAEKFTVTKMLLDSERSLPVQLIFCVLNQQHYRVKYHGSLITKLNRVCCS